MNLARWAGTVRRWSSYNNMKLTPSQPVTILADRVDRRYIPHMARFPDGSYFEIDDYWFQDPDEPTATTCSASARTGTVTPSRPSAWSASRSSDNRANRPTVCVHRY